MIPSWSRGALWLLVATAAGFAAGVVYERGRGQPMSGSPMDPVNVMRTLDKTLALDPAQHAGILAVFARRQAAIDSAWNALQPNMRAAVDSSQMEIVRLLRPDQSARFLELIRKTHPAPGGMTGKP